MTYETKIKLIRKYFKKNNVLLDIELIDYNSNNFYIRLDYDRKLKLHFLSWIDINLVDSKNIEKFINKEIVPAIYIDQMANLIKNSKLDEGLYYKDKDVFDGLIKFNLYFYEKKKRSCFEILFHRYVPNELEFIYNMFVNIFYNMPKRFEILLSELGANFLGLEKEYDYIKPYKFNLYEDDLKKMFDSKQIIKAKKIYNDKKVLFLEEIKGKFYAYIKGKECKTIVLIYDEKENNLRVFCSCKEKVLCSDICAVIMAIRDNFKNKFYKVSYIVETNDILEKASKFNFYLCCGIKKDKLILINNDAEIEFADIKNDFGKVLWEVIEDNEKDSLKEKIND